VPYCQKYTPTDSYYFGDFDHWEHFSFNYFHQKTVSAFKVDFPFDYGMFIRLRSFVYGLLATQTLVIRKYKFRKIFQFFSPVKIFYFALHINEDLVFTKSFET